MVLNITLSNGLVLRVTQDHELYLAERGPVAAISLKTGDALLGMFRGFNTEGTTFLVAPKTSPSPMSRRESREEGSACPSDPRKKTTIPE